MIVKGISATPDVVYKYTDYYELVWKDTGSGGKLDGAIWRAKNYQSEYCSLGDVAEDNYGYPKTKTVLVTAKKTKALVSPTSFTQVWKDSGSGANWDGAVYTMNAPAGYTCLGGVGMRHHSNPPDSKKYCCVKNEYVVRGGVVQAWNDKGTGSDKDVSLWTVIRAFGPFGVDAGNFIPVSGYGEPLSTYLLKGDNDKVRDAWSITRNESKELNLHEMSEMTMVWNDAGSGADADCSIWRPTVPAGYYPIGDVAVATHSRPRTAFAVRPSKTSDGLVRAPVSYTKIWSDRGSGADRDVTIWKANCPAGYVVLGNVATSGAYPDIGMIFCLKYQYTTSGGKWEYVWRDHGSGADADVTIWEAHPTTTTLQTTRGMGTIASHSGQPGSPNLLNKSMFTYWAEKPISKIYLSNVVYDLSAEKKLSQPAKMSPTNIQNSGDVEQKVVRTLSYETSQSSSFTFSQAIQLEITAEVEASLPLLGSATTTLGVSTTSTFETGTETTVTESDSISAEITIPAKSQTTAFITATEYKADIPFTATIRKVYYDGSEGSGIISGVYKGVQVTEANVQFGEIKPIA